MLFEQLASTIEDLILAGQLKPGERLPSEGALAARYGVSRPVVREALARLRVRRLIETQNGTGTFVRHPEPKDLTETLMRHLQLASTGSQAVANLYEARLAVELMSAQLAATRATEEELEEIHSHLQTMRDRQTAESDWTRADLAFHQAVAQAAHNPFLLTFLHPLTTVIEDISRSGHRDPTAVRRGLKAHERIWAALKARDGEAAAAAMRDHLDDSRNRLEETLRAAQQESEQEA
jgi:GntR family transcriptional repressor for pyruvate dehydrogenase complex